MPDTRGCHRRQGGDPGIGVIEGLQPAMRVAWPMALAVGDVHRCISNLREGGPSIGGRLHESASKEYERAMFVRAPYDRDVTLARSQI